jgi:hydroxyacyl-ACP dehydratase HTD2-like protein with hotdog domain
MRWSAAIENWHKIHYDQAFTREHEKLPGLLVNGTFKQQFIAQALTDWAGPGGWVWKVSFQFRSMNLVDEELAVWARVTGKRAADAFGLVDLELGIRNQEGKESTPGNAVVALPFREGAAVPYPFAPPARVAAAERSR